MSESELYYVRRKGRVQGPWPLEKLQAEAKLRKLARYHEVSVDGNSWQRASQMEGLFPKVETRKVVGATPEEAAAAAEQNQTEPNRVWYCVVDDEQRGPLLLEEVAEFVANGRLLLDDLVWREGYADWLPTEEVPELAPFLKASGGASDGVRTEATRLVIRPLPGTSSKMAISSAIAGGVVVLMSCVPPLGILGIVPATMGAVTLVQIRKKKAGGFGYALAGLIIGVLAVIWGVVAIVAAIVAALVTN